MNAPGQLLGTWVSDPEDEEGIRAFGRVTLEFEDDGRLTYTVHARGKDQKMFLLFRFEGDHIVTEQPSAPREERTAYSIAPNGKLTLWFGGQRSVYVRGE